MTFTVGDTAPNLTGSLASNGQPVNLSGATIAVHVRQPDRTVLTITATGTDQGAWTAPWPGPITQSGTHQLEVQVTYAAGGGIQTFGPSTFYVNQQIA